MRFGCFGFARHIPSIREAGFDSAELDFGELTAMTEGEFGTLRATAERAGLGFEVFSGLIPLTERFHSPNFDLDYWLRYIEKGARRAALMGARMIPFGAGKCRSIPPDCPDREAAENRVQDIVQRICDVLGEQNIMVVIEPLGPANSNYLNTIPETVQFVKSVARRNCEAMCDLRHMHKMKEPLTDIPNYKKHILHAHIDYPEGTRRFFPSPSDGYDYTPYFAALKSAGYTGLMTVEATEVRQDFLREARISAGYLCQMAERFGLS